MSLELAETPFVLILSETIEQRLDLLVSLSLGDTSGIGDLEELGRYFRQPAWLDGGDCADTRISSYSQCSSPAHLPHRQYSLVVMTSS